MFDLKNLESEFIIKKDWGYSYDLFHSNFLTVYINYVFCDRCSSVHYHKFKYNRFFVLSGKLQILAGNNFEYVIGPNEKLTKLDIIPMVEHQFMALEDTVFVEIESVRCIKDDIVRLSGSNFTQKRRQ